MTPSMAGALISGKAGKSTVLNEFSDMLTLSLIRGADYAYPLALPHQNFSVFMLLYGKRAFLISRSAVENIHTVAAVLTLLDLNKLFMGL